MNTLLANENKDSDEIVIENDLSSDILEDIDKADEFLINQKTFTNVNYDNENENDNASVISSKYKDSKKLKTNLIMEQNFDDLSLESKKYREKNEKTSRSIEENDNFSAGLQKNKEDSLSFSSFEKRIDNENHNGNEDLELESNFNCSKHLFHPIKYFCLKEAEFLCAACKLDHLNHKENIREYNEKSLFLEISKINNKLVQIKETTVDFQIQLKNIRKNTKDNDEQSIIITPNKIKSLFHSIYTFFSTPCLSQIPQKLKKTTRPRRKPNKIYFPDSHLVKTTEDQDFLIDIFNEKLDNSQITLLYRGTRDGFRAKNFHFYCDRKGATLTLIQSEKNLIFGGFASKSWKSREKGEFQSDPEAFIFSLSKQTKHELNEKFINKAIYFCENNGPVFGAGFDICISEKCNKDKESFANLGISYEIDEEFSPDQGRQYLAGEVYFNVKEIEVFKIKY